MNAGKPSIWEGQWIGIGIGIPCICTLFNTLLRFSRNANKTFRRNMHGEGGMSKIGPSTCHIWHSIEQISFLFSFSFSFFLSWTTLCFCFKNQSICLAMIWSNRKRKLVSNQNFITLPWLLAGDWWVGWFLALLYKATWHYYWFMNHKKTSNYYFVTSW